jgi:predicted nucleic acid-binding protein
LGWLKEEPDKVENCRMIITPAERGEIKIITSAFTLTEVLYLNFNDRIPATEAEKINAFFENDYILTVALDREIAKSAQKLVWEYGVHPKDATHLATALQVALEIVDTFDEELITRFNNRIGTPPLKIGIPRYPLQLSLDDQNRG